MNEGQAVDKDALRIEFEAYRKLCAEFDAEMEKIIDTASKEELMAFLDTEPKRPAWLDELVYGQPNDAA